MRMGVGGVAGIPWGWGGLLAVVAGCGGTVRSPDTTVPVDPPSPTSGAPQDSKSLTVVSDGGGKVTSTPPGISCPGTCSASFAKGAEVTLAGAGSGGDELSEWG